MGSRDSKKMKVKQIINLILQRLGNLIKIMEAVRKLLLHYLTKKRLIKKKNLKYNRRNLIS